MVRIGVIGAGDIAGVHLKNLSEIEGAKIAALCDISEENLAKKTAEFGGTSYADYEEMLDRESLDGVLLCSPATVRKDPIRACVERKVPIFIEKPPAVTLAEGREIEKILVKADHPHFIGFVFRWNDPVEEFVQRVGDRPIYAIQSHYFCDMMFPERKAKLSPAFYDKAKSGGLVGDQAIHILDLIRYLSRSEPKTVHAIANNLFQPKTEDITSEETVAIQIGLEGGAVSNHLHSWAHPRCETKMQVFGEGFEARFSLSGAEVEIVENGSTFHKKQESQLHKPEIEAFVEFCRTGDRSLVKSDIADSLATLDLVARVDRSLENGDVVRRET